MSAEDFRAAVLRAVAAIPPGKAATFGMLAALAGNPRAARLAARAVGNAPGGLPCHRVVRAGGVLVPAHVFGPGVQHALLLSEGVAFNTQGRVCRECLWRLEDIPVNR